MGQMKGTHHLKELMHNKVNNVKRTVESDKDLKLASRVSRVGFVNRPVQQHRGGGHWPGGCHSPQLGIAWTVSPNYPMTAGGERVARRPQVVEAETTKDRQ